VSSHACVEVSPSCKCFTKEQRIKPHYSNASPFRLIRCVCWGKPILQVFYKRTTHQTIRQRIKPHYSHASPFLLIRCVCWGKPILQVFYKRTTHQTIRQRIKPFDSASPARARNPRFLMHRFGQKTGFRARVHIIEQKIARFRTHYFRDVICIREYSNRAKFNTLL
jgi:hypothetical protein